MHTAIRRSPSATSSTVADPSKVTVRIESASTNDLNVQDVVTNSSSDDDDEALQHQKKQNHTDRLHNQISSTTNRRHTSALSTNTTTLHQHRTSRLNTDVSSSMRVPSSRPMTAVSLPAKPFAYDNEWDLDSPRTSVPTVQRRNPSCPSISPTITRAKPPSQSIFTHQQVPTVFTTTSECLGRDLRPQPRRDTPRRSQSLAKQIPMMTNSASPTVPIVFLTNDILLGSIRALQNERQLCKFSVDYLIDATNMRPDELARKANIGARLPCHCGHAHSRCTLTLEFDQPYLPITSASNTTTNDHNYHSGKTRESNRTQLSQLFSAVNRFITKAQQEEKRILIYGFELTVNSPLAVIAIQYLMLTDEQLSLTEATNRIHRLFPIIPLQHQQYPVMEQRFRDYLKQLERKHFPSNFLASSSISGDGSSSGNETRLSPRELSWESSETTTNSTPVTSWTTIPIPIVNNTVHSSHRLFSTRSAWDS